MRNLLVAALFCIAPNRTSQRRRLQRQHDGHVASPPRIVTHRVWSLECDPAEGGPYFVGYDSGDKTIQIKTPNGRPYTYAARAEQVGPGVSRVLAIRPDQNRYLVITIAGNSSSLQAIGRNAGGSPGGTDYCHVVNGWD